MVTDSEKNNPFILTKLLLQSKRTQEYGFGGLKLSTALGWQLYPEVVNSIHPLVILVICKESVGLTTLNE